MTLTRRRFLILGAAAVIPAVALASACAPSAPVVAPTVQPTAPAVTSALKIGVLLPYTESSIGVDIGLNQKRAADLYLKQRGGKLGGRPVNLVYSAESIESGINGTKVRTLTDTEHVELLMGGASPDSAQILRDAAESLRMAYFATNATTHALTQSKFIFRTSASARQLCEPFGEWASAQGHGEFFACGVDDNSGTESVDAFVAGLAKHGGGATARVSIASGGNIASLLAAIKAQPTKNVFAAFTTDDAEAFIAEWGKQGLSQAGYALFGPGSLADEEVLAQANAAAIGVMTSLFWSPDLDNAENKNLVDAFPKEYVDDDTGQPVRLSGYAVQMWDAMRALDLALDKTGGDVSNVNALIASLEGVSFASPRGTFAFDQASHNPVQSMLVREVVSSPSGKPVNSIAAKLAPMAVGFGSAQTVRLVCRC